jgi:hypothetical protein
METLGTSDELDRTVLLARPIVRSDENSMGCCGGNWRTHVHGWAYFGIMRPAGLRSIQRTEQIPALRYPHAARHRVAQSSMNWNRPFLENIYDICGTYR